MNVQGSPYKTSDGGENWTRQALAFGASSINEMAFADLNTGWGVGPSGNVSVTTNGGDTWSLEKAGTQALSSIAVVSTEDVWLAGSEGIFRKQGDRSNPWKLQETDAPVSSVSFLDEQTGWAVGLEGVILRTNDGGGD